VGSGYTEPNGIFWFGTDEGLIRLDPNMEYNVDHPVPLYFTSVFSGEETLSLPEHLAGAIPEFPFKGNTISFSYVAPFFVKENRISYQTYLEGFDDGWGKWDSNVSREFANLPYGTYTFRVRAKNVFNMISDEIEYSFVVLPPWYATWWAYTLYFFGFGFVVFGLVKVQTNRVLAKEKEKNREKELEHAKEIEKAYENLKAAQDQLVQQEKLASLGQLTAGIAHEIKNPLNFVNNFSDLSIELIEEAREEVKEMLTTDSHQLSAILDDIEANLKKILEHGTRADGIVKSMLQHSRGGSGEMEPTDLNALIEEYANLAFHGMRAGKDPINVDIRLDLDDKIEEVPLISEDFSRVVLNLCNNAFDAMREKLTAESRQLSENPDESYGPQLMIKTFKKNSNITIEIQDNGPGIPDDIKDKILQPFFTTKKGTAGTGLGLSITNDIIKAHGGNLEVYSNENTGTVFSIDLPQTI
jgi:signal transduction histidine kinase